jgi:hypothetical protein
MVDQSDALYERWDKWFEELEAQARQLFTQRHIYYEVREIVRNNSRIQKPTDFFFWLSVWYASSMTVAVRKQSDNSRDSVSYRRLLEDIKAHPEVISRTRFKQRFVDGNYREHLADLDFDRYVGAGREHIDPAVVQSEIDELEAKTAKIRHYVNKRVAHHDKKEFKAIPQYSDLDEAIDYIGSLYKRYFLIFRCLDPRELLPHWGYDWKGVFRHPWLSGEL